MGASCSQILTSCNDLENKLNKDDIVILALAITELVLFCLLIELWNIQLTARVTVHKQVIVSSQGPLRRLIKSLYKNQLIRSAWNFFGYIKKYAI
ncbi:hypothetical protein evm_010064 [Chilo suppressalis]|nr:hypothetical protein evm_010064 [Chilo suppressalis]